MLKHVHVSAYSSHRSRAPDTLSLTSTASLSSNSSGTSTTSTTSSTAGSHEEELSVTSRSRCSSTASLINHRLNFTIPVKIYANVLRSDIEYKTVSVHPQTSSKELIGCVLNKFKMKHRDPNLFYLTIEVGVRKTGLRTVMMLDDEAKPVQLQACHPHGHTKLTLQMRRGGLLKVYDSCLMAGSQYKSLLLSERTTVDELIQLLLNCYNMSERTFNYSLYEVCKMKKCERKLHSDDCPLLVQQQWSVREHYAFYLRRNTAADEGTNRKVPWTRSLDVTGQVNFRLTLRDEVSPRIIHSPTLKPSYNDYENYFYI